MKYMIFWTMLVAAIIATFMHWLHPATFSINVLSLFWIATFVGALYVIDDEEAGISEPRVDVPERILHVTYFYPPSRNSEAAMIENVVEQSRNTIDSEEVRVITSMLHSESSEDVINGNDLLDDPMYVQRLHHLKIPFVKAPYLQALFAYIKYHEPDVIYVHGKNRQLLRAAKKYGRRRNTPVIIAEDAGE